MMSAEINYDNDGMRRQDRQMSREEAIDLLRRGEYGVLSLVGGGGVPYGVPMCYAWDGAASLYLHCAPEGEKLALLEANPEASFCIVGRTGVLAQKFSMEFESLVARCRAAVVDGEEEKKRGLLLLAAKYSPAYAEEGRQYVERAHAKTTVVRLDVVSMSGKRRFAK